ALFDRGLPRLTLGLAGAHRLALRLLHPKGLCASGSSGFRVGSIFYLTASAEELGARPRRPPDAVPAARTVPLMGRGARRQRKPFLGLTTPSWTHPRRLEKSGVVWLRSEEHTSELQSRFDLVCRLLLEKKK